MALAEMLQSLPLSQKTWNFFPYHQEEPTDGIFYVMTVLAKRWSYIQGWICVCLFEKGKVFCSSDWPLTLLSVYLPSALLALVHQRPPGLLPGGS